MRTSEDPLWAKFVERPFPTIRRTDDEGETRAFPLPGGSLRFLRLPDRQRTRGGGGGGSGDQAPGLLPEAPVGRTKICVQAVLKARSTTLGHYRRGYPFFGYNDV